VKSFLQQQDERLKERCLLTAPLSWAGVPTSAWQMHLPREHAEISGWQQWISAGTRHPPWWQLTLFFCFLNLVCGVVEMKANQGTVLKICEVPAAEKEGQKVLGHQSSLN